MRTRIAEVNNFFAAPLEEKARGRTLSLIVDDEEDICFLLKDILSKRNIENVSVNNLSDAISFLQSHDPALIFLDNKLSDGLGVDHIKSIKKNHPTTRIIMITAHDNYRDRAISEGADFFISKPFSKKTILETLEKID